MSSRGASLCTMTKAASSGMGTWCICRVAKSMWSAWPATAPAMASGSSRPTCEPALRSASWQSWANARGSGSWPRASSNATANAALEDSPAPTGRVLVTRATPPDGGAWARKSPAANAASCGTGAVSPSRISIGWPGNWSESIPKRKLPDFGVKVTSVARSMAIGSESPPL